MHREGILDRKTLDYKIQRNVLLLAGLVKYSFHTTDRHNTETLDQRGGGGLTPLSFFQMRKFT